MLRRAIFIGSFPLLRGGVPTIRRINEAGWQAVVVTNESEHDDDLRTALLDEGVRLDGVYHCPHDGNAGCRCHKPGIALLERARDEMGIELTSSWFIGDGPTDLETAHAAGIPGILVGGAQAETLEDAVARALDGEA